MTFSRFLTLALTGVALSATPVMAEDATPMLGIGLGYYDILDNEDDSADFRLEYRPGYEFWGGFRSFIGAEATSNGSVWAGTGLVYDWTPTDNIYINPSFGVGLYAPGGSDKDLDYPVEFRSQLEGGYILESGSRVGLAFGHTSNASLGDDNPGSETLNMYYHVPVNW